MASGRGKSKDAIVTDEQLAEVEYELARNRNIEENEKRMALIREKHAALREVYEASQPAKQRKRKAPSSAPDNTAERRVLRSRGANGRDNANPTDQPSKEITTKLVDGKKGGRTITKKANIYARMNKPKIKIPFNEHGQPIGLDATEFANFIGTLVRKHIPPKTIDWRDVDEEKKLLVWDYLQAFYEVDSIALRYVINTSLRKWKEWKADLKKTKFDPELTDEELMHERDERISEADWKELLKYWRSPEFEARSCTAKENRAKSTVPHTAGSKSHARVTQEMNSRAEIEEEIDGEDGDEEDSEDGNVQRRKIVANPRNSSTQQDESLVSF
ncbi:hypothetical protein ACQ4PT_066142 [Festuca glaucescens]